MPGFLRLAGMHKTDSGTPAIPVWQVFGALTATAIELVTYAVYEGRAEQLADLVLQPGASERQNRSQHLAASCGNSSQSRSEITTGAEISQHRGPGQPTGWAPRWRST